MGEGQHFPNHIVWGRNEDDVESLRRRLGSACRYGLVAQHQSKEPRYHEKATHPPIVHRLGRVAPVPMRESGEVVFSALWSASDSAESAVRDNAHL